MSEDAFTRVYTGSEVNVQHLQNLLEDQGIATRVRNDFESGLRAGFSGGLPGQVQLFAETQHLAKATEIANETFPEK